MWSQQTNTSSRIATPFESQKELADWKETLTEPPPLRQLSFQSSDLKPLTCFFGTMSDSKWIEESIAIYQELGEKAGLTKDEIQAMIFNPKIETGRIWTEQDGKKEAEAVATASVIQMSIENDYESVGSMLELGFIALRAYLGEKSVIVSVEEPDHNLADSTKRARGQLRLDALHIQKKIPYYFQTYDQSEEATDASFQKQREFIASIEGKQPSTITKEIHSKTVVQNRVCISGTSSDPNSDERSLMLAGLAAANIDYYDTVEHWQIDRYVESHIPAKEESLVNTVIITDPESKGAIKDVGLAVFRAIVNQSYALIYLPEKDNETYTRARKLAIAHWNQLKSTCSWATHYVKFVENMDDMLSCANAISKAYESAPHA